ncbi:MAG: hypothetical protein JWP89_2332 [Schlesneria sp.]|nr:hypothetical protein [Schlesneria sp.]
MSSFNAFKKMGEKQKVHRTKQGDQTSRQSAQHLESHKRSSGIGLGSTRKTGGRVQKRG